MVVYNQDSDPGLGHGPVTQNRPSLLPVRGPRLATKCRV
jgi:hypothetical protein